MLTCKQLLSETAQSIKINHKFIFWALSVMIACVIIMIMQSLSLSITILSLAQAFSAFFYTHSFLQEATGIRITSPEHLEEATYVVCNMSFQEVPPLWANFEPCYSEMTFPISQQSTSDWESQVLRLRELT